MTDSTSFLPSDQPTSTLDARVGGTRPVTPTGSHFERGDSVSRFTVLDHLGTGGMGQVYAAYDPRLDRKIALKILRPFRASVGRESRARLLREARALARLNDPNVLTLFDVGTFGDQIFLATEFVPGEHLGRWLKDAPRSVDEILEVFRQAGRGLMAAHEAGLVHRDFKLGNVMVRPDGRALVLDFGLARHGVADVVEAPPSTAPGTVSGDRFDGELTQTGARLGTPRFMAPEQWAGEPAGPAADQFSFCVSLYEALYGEPPFPPSSSRHEPPDWTSEPVPAAVSTSGLAVPARVRKILLRGLAIDPVDRFPSMRQILDQLAADPGRRWRRIAVVASMMAMIGMALWRPWDTAPQPCRGGEQRLASAWGDEQRRRLDAALIGTGVPWAEAAARSTVGRLDTYAESWLDMYRDTCESTHVRGEQSAELLDRRMACLDHRRRQLDALVRLVVAEPAVVVDGVVAAVDRLPGLEPCADTAALLAVLEPPADPTARRAIDQLRERLAEVEALLFAGRYDRAAVIAERLRAEAEAQGYLPLVAEVLVTQGKVHSLAGSAEEAATILERALQVAQATRHDRPAADAFVRLVRVTGYQLAEFERGERFAVLASTLLGKLDRGDDLRADLADHLGVVALQKGEYERAASLHRQALDSRRALGDDDGPAAATSRIRLGNVLFEQGDWAAAEEHFADALRVQEAALGGDHPTVAATLDRLGVVAHRRGDLALARDYLERALALLQAVFGDANPRLASTLGHLANVVSSEGRPEAALALYDQVLPLYVAEHGEAHPWVGITWINIGETKTQMGDFDGAVDALSRALEIVEAAYGRDHPMVAQVLSTQGSAFDELGQFERGEALHRRALAIQSEHYGDQHPLLGHALTALGNSLLGQGRSGEAIGYLERALDILDDPATDPVHLAWGRWMLARALSTDDPPRALALARRAEAEFEAAAGDHASSLSAIRAWLAERDRRERSAPSG